MPSYLYQEQFVPLQPYQAPNELYGKALAIKDARFKEGLMNIRSKYDSILNTPLTNDVNQLKLRSGVENVMNRLSKVAVTDLSLPENQSQVNSLFDPIINDNDLLYDMAWTRNYQGELSKAETLQKQKPELVPPQNLEPLYLAQEAYRKGDPTTRPGQVRFSPYYDFNGKMNEELEKVKADVERVFSVATNEVEGPDGKMHRVGSPLQWTVKQLKDYKVNQMLWERLGTDPQALGQMSLDYNYNTRHGFYPAEGAVKGIDSDVSTYKAIVEGLNQALSLGINMNGDPLTEADRTTYEARVQTTNAELSRLQQLRSEIKSDPSKSNKWFTFNKHIKDYIESKGRQYSYKEEGLIQDVPGLSELTKYQFDVWKEQWKAKGEVDKEAAKRAAETQADLAIVPTPYADLITKLDSTKTGMVNATNQEVQALGQMTVDKDGKMFMNWTGNNTNPDNTLIMRPAEGALSTQQITTVNGNVILGKMKQELEALGYTQKVTTDGMKTETDDFGVTVVTQPSSYERKKSGDEILVDYTKNPTDPKVKKIVDKYSPILSGYKIDPLNADHRKTLEQGLEDPTIEDAVKFGTTINLNGRFQFVPDQGDNLVKGDNGKLYMKGKYIATGAQLKEAGVSRGDDLVSKWETISVVSDDDGGKYKRVNEQTYGISVYVPVNGDVGAVNDRMLDSQNFQDQWGNKAPQYRQYSNQRARQFQESYLRSGQLEGLDVPLRQENGQFSLMPETVRGMFGRGVSLPANQKAAVDQINKLSSDIATRTGLDPDQVKQGVINIFGQNQTPLQRQLALDAFNPASTNNPVVEGFKRGISGNESRGDYSAGAQPGQRLNNLGSTAAGRYGILESTFGFIKNLPGFPAQFKAKTFDDFKKDPMLQELSTNMLASYYYNRFQDPVTMAVAWFTGPESEETKAFMSNKEAAYQKYRNQKPSTGRGLQNMTIGAYVDNFLRNYNK